MPTLNTIQTQIVQNLVALQESEDFFQAYTVFLEDEINFTFEEVETISMFYGWA